MAPEPQPTSNERERLPFEPGKRRKKGAETENTAAPTPSQPKTKGLSQREPVKPSKTADGSTAIPQVVSQRMARRMAVFSGIPSSLGVVVFFASYWIVSQGLLKIPTVAVILLSMGCFGLGVLGLSYGVISASWDEEASGSLLGWSEFKTNFGRLTQSWRSVRQSKESHES